MKLTSIQIERTADQFEARPIPEDNRLVPELSGLFGDHTFFLAKAGLHIVEPMKSRQAGALRGRVVKLASWTYPYNTTLVPHDPELTEVVVDLDRAA